MHPDAVIKIAQMRFRIMRDMALCKILAFWTGNNIYQIDRIFRGSLLMRDKWDQKRSATNRKGVNLSAGTYGSQTIEYAIATQVDIYTPPKEKIIIKNTEPVSHENTPETFEVVEFDERNDPKITIKNIFNTHYSLNDTGNAERFYDYFGENFKYNCDNNYFMFWDGRTWKHDIKGYVRKYANKLLDVLYSEIKQTGKEYEEAVKKAAEAELLARQQEAMRVQDSIRGVSAEAERISAEEAMKLSLGSMLAAATEGEEKFYVVENDLARYTFSNRGGRIASVELKDYKTYKNTPLMLCQAAPCSFSSFTRRTPSMS